MKHYHVTTVPCDGWKAVEGVPLDCTYLQTPETVCASAKLCADTDALLIHMELCCPQLRSVEEGPLGMPCQDSCLEFFFCPIPGDDRYFNFEWNPNGCLFLGMGSGLADLTRLIVDDYETRFAPSFQRNTNGFVLEYKIPYSFIRRFFPAFQPEGAIRGNFYACSDLSDPAYYLSWNPIDGEPFTFHRSECFGLLKFM